MIVGNLKRLGEWRAARQLCCKLSVHIEDTVVEAATALLAVAVFLRTMMQQQLSFPLRGGFVEWCEDVAAEFGGFWVAKELRREAGIAALTLGVWRTRQRRLADSAPLRSAFPEHGVGAAMADVGVVVVRLLIRVG